MYLRITSKCNMRCGHCGYSCEPGKGEHMTMATFHAALGVTQDLGQHLVLGGGEPTLHPHFESITLQAMAASEESPLLIVTNGTHKRRSLMLATLAKQGCLDAELSNDVWHDDSMVNIEVYHAFEGRLRNVTGKEVCVGRFLETSCLDWGDVEHNNCVCPDWTVEPDGTIKQCGCEDAPIIGNVTDGIFSPYTSCSGECCHSAEFEELVEEAA